jgi:hypothetical protein
VYQPTDNAAAVLYNLVQHLGVPVSPGAVMQAVFDHPDFPFLSLYHLTQLLGAWGLRAEAGRIPPESLPAIPLPALAFVEKPQPACVMLHHCDADRVSYLDPATGWVEEPVTAFRERWSGVVVLVGVPAGEELPPVRPVPAPPQRAALAVTLVDAELTLDSFIRYHLAIGFAHLYLFFDRPGDPGLRTARTYPGVTAIERDDALASRWRSCRQYPQLAGQLQRPQARQLLNVEIAAGLALDAGLHWLLQMDADELFYLPRGSVTEHFTALADRQVYGVTYPNYEAVSGQLNVGDYFREVTLFKRNPVHLAAGQQEVLAAHVSAGTNAGFLAYANGKSAARLDGALLPWGNHHFQWRRGTTHFQKPGVTLSEAAADPSGPLVLHYAECGFSHFLRKYRTWGDFPDTYLGGQRIIDRVPFRIRAREVVKTGDVQRAEAFYRREAILGDASMLARLLDEGLLCRITGPAEVLGKNGEVGIEGLGD